ncbi:MAG: DUF6507 family protein [Rhodoglobus sp.]
MGSWSVSPDGVRTVIADVKAEATLLDQVFVDMGVTLDAALTAVQSSAVSGAVAAWLEAEAPSVEGISVRLSEAVTGVVGATEAFIAGDELMAGQVQAAHAGAGESAGASFVEALGAKRAKRGVV